MVEPAGAMAMFVLRLAGLLSLENALQDQKDNLTDSVYNFTDIAINQSVSGVNLSWAGLDASNPATAANVPGESSSAIDLLQTTSPTLQSSAPSTTVPFPPSTITLHSTNIITSMPKTTAPVHKTPVPPINVNFNRNTKKINRRRNHTSSARRRKLTKGQSQSERTDLIRSSHTIHGQSSGTEEMLPLADASTDQQIPKPEHYSDDQSIGDIPKTDTDERELEDPTQTKKDFDEAITSDSSSHPQSQIKLGRSDYSSELYPESFSVITPLPVTATMQPTAETDELPSMSPTQMATDKPQPRLEMLAEDDGELLGLLDHQKLRSLEAPPEDYIRSDFEYYDFSVHHEDALQTEAPTLSSLNLVSPVPSGRFVAPESVPRKKPEERTEPQPSRPRKLPPARPIPPSQPRSGLRNNPYPYGPKLLPGPYAPLTPNLPSPATDDETRGRHVPTEYSYEEDFEYYYDSHESGDSRYEVQTKEPPVLFVFDKPGYSPEAPTTLLPATRSPTPSDPWDCAPRCPRYTLLDWNTDYDVRQYPRTTWVSTVIISENRVLAELEGYMRVQDYFYGLNDQGLVLNLTVPFVTQIKFGKHPGVLHEMNDYTVSLYVQPSATPNAVELPTPISNEVLVDDLETKTVFVHSFEANVWDVTEKFLETKVETLMTQLRHNGEAFLDRYYYLASYSRPELYQPVYYEVWVYATNFRDPQTSSASAGIGRLPQTNKVTQKTLSKLCRGVECPNFEVIRTYKYGIQKRRYYNGLFASTFPKECQFTTMSVWKGFMPLHLYKHGINSHMEVIEATRPIALVNIRDSSDPNTECPQNMTMSLYLPKRLHSNPPITGFAAPEVHITSLNDVIVYVYTVGGYLLDPQRVRKELADMKYRLTEFGACYKDDEYYVVIYDFIVRYHGRQNEIWIVAENCKATHNG
ncbi:uncharacterized protein LOC135222478 [Macrobrachium nipponense]|uniref:uncharacterized protein LOC135222478 n=1 Tax=Macrobrachium nipponense TaxID=159736 RepID=UPI0030C886DB